MNVGQENESQLEEWLEALPDEELRKSERRLRTIADNLPALIANVDANCRYRFVNKPYERWLGLRSDQIIGKHVEEVLGVDAYARIRPHVLQALSGRRVDFRQAQTSKQGAERVLRTTYVPETDDSDEVIGYFSLVVDITSQAEEAAARQRSEARYAAILDNSTDAIISVDERFRMVVFNKGAERIFGYSAEEAIGRPLDMLIPPDNRDRHQGWIRAFLESDESARAMSTRPEIQGLRKDGEVFPAEAVISKKEVGGGILMTAFLRDITDRRRLEEQYRQAQKMEAVGRFAGGIAHDFNNLLSGVLGYGELLKSNLAEGDPRHRHVDEILSCAERGGSLTRQLLLFSRHQVSKPKVVDINAAVRGIEEMLRRLIGEDISLVTRFSSNPESVRIDVAQLEQTLMNLAVNARDAMPRGGALAIRTGRTRVDSSRSRLLGGLEPGLYVTLAVQDTGCGMDAKTISRVFDPFFTTKEKGKGTGLGLSMAYGIVQRFKGHIDVRSSPGKGAAFVIYLPLAEEPLKALPQVDKASQIERGSECVLLVEDDEALCRLSAEILERSGYEVLQAGNAGEAIMISEKRSHAIDLLLTDVVMPCMSGGELARRLLKVRPDLKVLYISGYSDDELVNNALIDRKAVLLQKPFSPGDLNAMVRRVLDE